MSYHRKNLHRGNGGPLGLGDVASVASTAASVVSDPYFNEAVCRVQQLSAIENGTKMPACTKTAAGLRGGIGLRPVMPALRSYVSASSYPGKWPLYAAIAGAIGVPLMIGYAIGKGRR